jgi:hypothetical protein
MKVTLTYEVLSTYKVDVDIPEDILTAIPHGWDLTEYLAANQDDWRDAVNPDVDAEVEANVVSLRNAELDPAHCILTTDLKHVRNEPQVSGDGPEWYCYACGAILLRCEFCVPQVPHAAQSPPAPEKRDG